MKSNRKYEAEKIIKEWYFVEYHPANYFKFANLHLVLLTENAKVNDITSAMEKELKYWLELYPVPLFVSVFTNQGRLYKSPEIKDKNHLTGFFDQEGKLRLRWGLLKDEEIPNTALNQIYLDDLYSKFRFTTDEEYAIDREKRRRQIKIGRIILFLIIPVLVPFVYESIAYFNNRFSNLFSYLAFTYVIFKTVQETIRFMNVWPKSKRQVEREKEEAMKNHYYYFCEKNPETFKKLKLEVLEKEAKDLIAKEAKELQDGEL